MSIPISPTSHNNANNYLSVSMGVVSEAVSSYQRYITNSIFSLLPASVRPLAERVVITYSPYASTAFAMGIAALPVATSLWNAFRSNPQATDFSARSLCKRVVIGSAQVAFLTVCMPQLGVAGVGIFGLLAIGGGVTSILIDKYTFRRQTAAEEQSHTKHDEPKTKDADKRVSTGCGSDSPAGISASDKDNSSSDDADTIIGSDAPASNNSSDDTTVENNFVGGATEDENFTDNVTMKKSPYSSERDFETPELDNRSTISDSSDSAASSNDSLVSTVENTEEDGIYEKALKRKRIGEGGFGKVYVERSEAQDIAVKEFKKKSFDTF